MTPLNIALFHSALEKWEATSFALFPHMLESNVDRTCAVVNLSGVGYSLPRPSLTPSSIEEVRTDCPPTNSGVLIEAYRNLSRLSTHDAKFMLSESQRNSWTNQLRDLAVLLVESKATWLGVLIYVADEMLVCEVGRPGRTLVLAIDDEGSTVSFRNSSDDFRNYFMRSWDGLPALDEFTGILADYKKPESTECKIKFSPDWKIMNSLGDVFVTPTRLSQSSTLTAAFASHLAHL